MAASVLFCSLSGGATAQTQVTGQYAGYYMQAKQQMDQAKIQVEQLKLRQAEYRANRNETAARQLDPEIKKYQNQATLKQQEMSMYQQQDSLTKQPLSPFPAVAAAQTQMRQWMFEKAQLNLRKSAAMQVDNPGLAQQLTQQMDSLQLRITAKQQEIRLLEMKAKAGQ